jgi:hypothetical protein
MLTARSYFKDNADFTSIVLIAIVLIQLIFCVWAIDKGFDFSDEAFSYLGFAFPAEKSQTLTYYTKLITAFFSWTQLNIVHVRILRLITILVCSGAFWFGLSRCISKNSLFSKSKINPLSLFALILVGSLIINSTGDQGFTYNLISVSLFQLIIGFFLVAISPDKKRSIKKELLLFYLIGALLFALFLVKFSNALLLGPILLLLLISKKVEIKTIFQYALVGATGAFCMGLFVMDGLSGFTEWISDFIDTLSGQGKYSVSLLTIYQEDLKHVKNDLVLPNIDKGLLSIFFLTVSCFISNRILNFLAIFSFIVVVAIVTLTNNYYLGGASHAYTLTFTYIYLLLVMIPSAFLVSVINYFIKGYSLINWDGLILLLLLIIIPFAGTLGTGNRISYLAIVYFPFVLSFIYLLSSSFGKGLSSMLVIFMAITATSEVITSILYFPYRLAANRLEQTMPVIGLSNLEGVKFDSASYKSIDQTRNLILARTQYSSGMPIFSFRTEYGLIYALNGRLPGWFWYKDEASEQNCFALSKSESTNLENTIFILPKSHVIDSTFYRCLHNLNIEFPEKYVELGEVDYTSEGNKRPLVIFSPRSMLKY